MSAMVGNPGFGKPGDLSGLDEAEMQCWDQFFQSAWLFYETLNRELVGTHNLSLFDVQLLDLLAKSEGGSARMGDVAEALILQPSRVTEQIRRLESDGLVLRRASKRDRRGVVATVTQEGRARLKPALVTYSRVVRTFYLGQMSRQQMIALGESSRRVAVGLKSRMAAKIGRI
ncbi:MarR family winged helix-turn-helix transcriptional regulator [Mycolicibacterium wolinskyi]|uniref:MarR family winged helix-turn-helix transcriptional regulator n=1 Tax=Mycolicibacterium wolinskyi TaxID=59750 RepID=UPI00391776CA